MSLWKAYQKVKAAVDTAYGETHDLGTVRVSGGAITATDSKLLARAPIDLDDEFAVSAPALEKCFKRFENPKVTVGDQFLTVSEKRRRARIQLLDPREVVGMEFQESLLRAAPEGIRAACAKLRPYLSDDMARPSLCGVHFEDGRAFATDGRIIAETRTDTFGIPVTFPAWLVDYIIRREETIVSAYANEAQIGFRFCDGSHVVSCRFAQDMDAVRVSRIVEQSYEKPDVVITPDMREAILDAIEFAEDQIIIGPGAVKTEKGVTQFSTDVESAVTLDTVWSPKVVAAMMKHATHFDARKWPEPCSWRGENIRGLIIGRR